MGRRAASRPFEPRSVTSLTGRTEPRGTMRGALWLVGGAIFTPLFVLSVVEARQGFERGIWARNDLLRTSEIWSPQTGQWTASGDLVEPAAGAEAVAVGAAQALAVQVEQDGLHAQLW